MVHVLLRDEGMAVGRNARVKVSVPSTRLAAC